jgi:precorrin-2 C20-methyltransferase/precorrin-3B C17-methyltransferase
VLDDVRRTGLLPAPAHDLVRNVMTSPLSGLDGGRVDVRPVARHLDRLLCEAAEDPRYAEVDIVVLPGVSAVQAVAARAGAPIGADFAVLSLSDRLKPWTVVEKRLRAVAEADLVLAIYNPASRSRTEQMVQARKVLLENRSPDAVVVLGRNVGRDGESLTVTTLGDLDTSVVDMSTLLIVGASSTRTTTRGQVWTPRYVEP